MTPREFSKMADEIRASWEEMQAKLHVADEKIKILSEALKDIAIAPWVNNDRPSMGAFIKALAANALEEAGLE